MTDDLEAIDPSTAGEMYIADRENERDEMVDPDLIKSILDGQKSISVALLKSSIGDEFQ